MILETGIGICHHHAMWNWTHRTCHLAEAARQQSPRMRTNPRSALPENQPTCAAGRPDTLNKENTRLLTDFLNSEATASDCLSDKLPIIPICKAQGSSMCWQGRFAK